jgi:hypothetical protein
LAFWRLGLRRESPEDGEVSQASQASQAVVLLVWLCSIPGIGVIL